MAEPIEKTIPQLAAEQSAAYVIKFWDDFQSATMQHRQKLVDYYKQYRGIPNRKNYEGTANVVVNETLGACESIVAQEFQSIFSEPKYLMIVGREETDDKKAALMQKMMFAALDEMEFKKKMLPSIRQGGKYGTAIAKICWEYEEKDVTLRRQDPETQVYQIAVERKVVKDAPDMQYVDLLDVALDVGKSDIQKMKLVVWRRKVDWDYIKDKERRGIYSSEQVAKIDRSKKGNSSSSVNQKEQRFRSVGINVDTLGGSGDYEILEAWGKVPRWWVDDDIDVNSPEAEEIVQAVIEVVNGGPTLRLERNPYWHQEIPFIMGHYIQVDDEAFGMGVCEISESLQQELNDKRNQLLDNASKQLDPPLIRNRNGNTLKSEIQLTAHKIIDSDLPGDASLTPLKLGGNFQENVQLDMVCKQDIRNMTGATSPVQGISSNKESTAFEINALLSRGSNRIAVATVDFSEKFVKNAYKMIYKLLYQYTTKEKAIRTIGKDGVKWETVSPQDIILDVDIIPKVPTDFDSRTIVRQQLLQFLQAIGVAYPQINIYRIARRVYQTFGFDDEDEVVPPPETEKGQDDLSIQEEIMVLTMGQKIDVKYWENHLQKMAMLMQFLGQNGPRMDPKAVEAFQDKIMQHQKYLQVLEAQAQAAMSPSGFGVNRGTPEKPVPSGPVDVSAQSQRDLARVA